MIRLWTRIGIVRTLSIVIILLGVVGGLALAGVETRHRDGASSASSATEGNAESLRQLEQDLTDRRSAQGKAQELALADAEQVKVADAQARKNNVPGRSESKKPETGVSAGPVPGSCSSYSGNKGIGCALLLRAGFGLSEMPCLDKLWTKESHWKATANNPAGGYGIPQANPGSRMAVFGSDWKTNPATQVAWGLNYIKGRYGRPCGAWSHSQSHGWY